MNKEQTIPKPIQEALERILNKCEREDLEKRRRQVRIWKKLDKFWHGAQHIFWSARDADWLSPADLGNNLIDDPPYDYVVNIFRAHGEAVIAALGSSVPAVRFPPDNAENEDDLITSKTYTRIAELIIKHINAKPTLLQSLFYLWNQGLVFAHHYAKQDKAYGEYKIPTYKHELDCPTCNTREEVGVNTACPQCGQQRELINVLDSFESVPKSRVCIDLYGPLYVKIPTDVTKQGECGYLLLCKDQAIEYLQSIYPEIRDQIVPDVGGDIEFERVARAPSSSAGTLYSENNRFLATHKQFWIRPFQFECEADEKLRAQLYELFPEGAYTSFVGKVFASARPAKMDDEWTICKAGLSTHIHSDPIGMPLVPIQELTNTHVNLTQDTIEHGIPSQFADPDVIDFDTYGKQNSKPGFIYPARPKTGQSVASAFFETSRASLSKEVGQFGGWLKEQGQFVVGSTPSIYGGPSEGGGTASEYSQSKQMALQRLSIVWTFVGQFWCSLVGKGVKIYVDNLVSDDNFTQRQGDNYINVWIRRSELSGKVGEVEPESEEAFPITIAQKQAMLLKLVEMNNDFINAALFDPTNRSVVAETLSMTEMSIPGEDQRIKQAREIQQIVAGQPVQPEQFIDDHDIHFEVCKAYLVSSQGLDLQRTNPQGYAAVLQHAMTHKQMEVQEAMTQGQGQPQPNQQAPQQKGTVQ